MKQSIVLADSPFYTIQGEGPHTGYPAVFIRIQGCTVGCQWCDTKYSWPNAKAGKSWTFSDIESEIEKAPRSAIIVITGGEPCEHEHELVALLQVIRYKRSVEIETSGYIYTPNLANLSDVVVISPKISPSAGVVAGKKITRDVANKWIGRFEQILYWKFVAQGEDDLHRILGVIEEWKLDRDRVWVMPEGLTREQLLNSSSLVAEFCKKEGVKFSYRVHVAVWGAKRGV
jgi:7-carboxy-7-deazaguanine synthase